ncbi:hypothetical protein [Serratia marcescens]|uniref:hypothetical protein n=1 Tax=Serratia marcescens TaxID=615 RepID=UPI0024B2E98A|nr:hypothetical protein [Serratia marcescens]MDI9108591.1 hypothetical protein [Serratia marcescens]
MVWQPGEFGRKVRFCRLFATIVAFFSRSGKKQRIKPPLFGVKYASGAGFFHNISR